MPASEDYGPLSALKQYLDYRPLGNDPWTNTMRGTPAAPGQGFATASDPVLYHTASPLVNITEGDIKRATDVGLAASGGGLKGQQIKAYHSSPHDFDKFDLGKIGTGEGAQVYGHGLYFAENPEVSGLGGNYWSAFLGRFPQQEQFAADALRYAGGDRAKALAQSQQGIDELRTKIRQASPEDVSNYLEPSLQSRLATHELLKSRGATGQIGPRTYEVNINADPAHMLDWDKPQTPEVLAKIQAAAQAIKPGLYDRMMGTGRDLDKFGLTESTFKDQLKGESAYGLLKGGLKSAPEASQALAEQGIPGIRYLDQGSRGPQIQTINGIRSFVPRSNTSNYVIFDPSKIDIRKKYGLAGLLPTAVGAGAAASEWFPPNPVKERQP